MLHVYTDKALRSTLISPGLFGVWENPRAAPRLAGRRRTGLG